MGGWLIKGSSGHLNILVWGSNLVQGKKSEELGDGGGEAYRFVQDLSGLKLANVLRIRVRWATQSVDANCSRLGGEGWRKVCKCLWSSPPPERHWSQEQVCMGSNLGQCKKRNEKGEELGERGEKYRFIRALCGLKLENVLKSGLGEPRSL